MHIVKRRLLAWRLTHTILATVTLGKSFTRRIHMLLLMRTLTELQVVSVCVCVCVSTL